MADGAVHPADLPKCVSVLRKPFATMDLFVAVDNAMARAIALRVKLHMSIEMSAESRAEARRLRSEFQHVIRQSGWKIEQLNKNAKARRA
jgi:hypothetical protein